MLSKLLKKDFRATRRFFIPLMLGFVVFSILCKILIEVTFFSPVMAQNEILTFTSIIFFSLYVIYIVGYSILTYVFLVYDFYKTMVSDQAYLTHTLPVKTTTLLNSKILIGAFWQFITNTLICLSAILFVVGHISGYEVSLLFTEMQQAFGPFFIQFLVFMIICVLLSFFSGPLMIYASIGIGHLFGKHRILGAIAAYFGIYTIMQIICTIAMFACGYSLFSIDVADNFAFLMNGYLWFTVIFSVITTAAFYFLTEYVFRRKLNLE